MNLPSRFSEKDLKAARNGADVYYWNHAKDNVQKSAEGMTIGDLIKTYCTDHHFAEEQVTAFLESLPTDGELVARAFTLFELLRSTRQELAAIVGTEVDMLEEASSGKTQKPIDDEAIRDSAGYTEDVDRDVADSSKTDAARENHVTDNDIGRSAAEDVVYRDMTASVSPAFVFIQQTQRLIEGIIDHCMNSNDIDLLVDAGLIERQEPRTIASQIRRLSRQLEVPRDEDR